MILQAQIKELGEWFQDTFPKYEFTTHYKYDGQQKWEEYYFILKGPRNFNKMVGLIIKDEWKTQSDKIDDIRAKFVPANQRAMKQMIDGNENPELLASIETKDMKFSLPVEQVIDEVGETDLAEFTKEYDARKNGS